MVSPEFVIAGAGIIGLSLALELDRRGASVTVLEAGSALKQASAAAAGMLAVNDPLNPALLRPLADLSAALYPSFLDHISQLSGHEVPFQTSATLESGSAFGALTDASELLLQLNPGSHHFHLLAERSVDPRQLAVALLAAVRHTSVALREHTPLQKVLTTTASVRVETASASIDCSKLIDCMGAWSPFLVSPRKGQMLAVALPAGVELACVVRTPEVYIVPRTLGPDAGRAIIGATLENAGFDLTVHAEDILSLNAKAVKLIPALADAEFLESWAGLRPATADGLPILGTSTRQPRYFLANGHFRNGILLAPATARVMAQMLLDEQPSVSVTPFAPDRFD